MYISQNFLDKISSTAGIEKLNFFQGMNIFNFKMCKYNLKICAEYNVQINVNMVGIFFWLINKFMKKTMKQCVCVWVYFLSCVFLEPI